jgi:hypothetical protein
MAKATIEAWEQEPSPAGSGRAAPRRVRVTIRRVHPWSVLKVSLVIYFCLLLVTLVGMAILFAVLDSAGVVDSVEEFLTVIWGGSEVATGPGQAPAAASFQVDFGFVMRILFLIGVVSTALWSAFTVFLAFLYNVIADLLGGVEVTLVERRSV